MSILSDFEDRVAGAVEGLFAGAFRSPVQPVELAKALARAMDDGRSIGVGKVYAPVSYTVALSREDRRNLGQFTGTLEGELATYLEAYANEKGYTLAARPHVRFDTHNDLRMGRFRVSAELAPSADETAAPAVAPAPHVPPAAPAPMTTVMPAVSAAPEDAVATLTVGDHDVALGGTRMALGRLRECDICLADQNVSRQHAALVREDGGWAVEDLESTNGTFVNGKRVERATLSDGDVIEIGTSRLIYHAPKAVG